MESRNSSRDQNATGETVVRGKKRMGIDSSSEEDEKDIDDWSISSREQGSDFMDSDDSSASSGCNVDVGGVEVLRSRDPQEMKLNEDDNSNVTSSIPVLEPCLGMEFESEDDAYNFYNGYEKEMGFLVRKFRVERSRVGNRVLARSYVCSQQGEKWCNDNRRKGMDYKPRATKKCNCGAVMRIKSRNGKWVVDLLKKEHNHPLVDPSQSFRLRSQQKMIDATMQLISKLHKCGIKQSDIISIVSEFAGGEENGSVSEERCRNIFRTKRRKTLGVGCQLAVNY
ncbi:protein FAR1-RELATED SEQUENCE 5-like [Telopea speciosissima]|uniref:protein FAR1-RELATED SEQUENCE 5-like n=1 Tax=Telopea speciosissima TaxID=54955 RepID=UPI001CC791E4|nr:protein FAR1-RELATED SEQUENCE 5-like [Telopea speciosissima]